MFSFKKIKNYAVKNPVIFILFLAVLAIGLYPLIEKNLTESFTARGRRRRDQQRRERFIRKAVIILQYRKRKEGRKFPPADEQKLKRLIPILREMEKSSRAKAKKQKIRIGKLKTDLDGCQKKKRGANQNAKIAKLNANIEKLKTDLSGCQKKNSERLAALENIEDELDTVF